MSALPLVQLPMPPLREIDAHKGSFGRVLIVAGSNRMSGAAVLAGLGALRGGAGLVYLAVPESVQAIVATAEPSYLVAAIPQTPEGRFYESSAAWVIERAANMDAVAIGPGLGMGEDVIEFVVELYRSLKVPLVIDADGLNALAHAGDHWHAPCPTACRILTPHPGEMSRLLQRSISDIQSARSASARELAQRTGCIVLLKGAGTVITDGHREGINPTGNPGMATGGTGDVLTGLITALLAQNMSPFDATRLGAYLHGLAGDLAAQDLSQPGLIASDLPRYLGKAWRQILPPQIPPM